ncbi:MAG: hypothetical protein H7A21_12585 [Spirochaetales bacterium]|nr:hypothetical protein [Leptospiraceae bacterium]MCP5482266.1 hypothetical protein [Spirochaetales bacterium]MCP5484622.1 hypothetical protein [Spirochaetales bacterium]
MANDLSALAPGELEQARSILSGLAEALQARKVLGSATGMIPDEEIVLNSIKHPERGDILVTVMRENKRLHLFVSNRRDPDNPFAIMDGKMLRDFPGRRPLNSHKTVLKEGEYALFLITIQDREMLRAHEKELVQVYSVHFGLAEEPRRAPRAEADVGNKPVSECTPQELWEVYRRAATGDSRVLEIERRFFGVPLTYSRYRGSKKEELLILSPDKYKEKIGQLIRDAYPYGVRVSLRRDYPAEHAEKLEEVHGYLRNLAEQYRQQIAEDAPDNLRSHVERVCEYIEDIVKNDPQLSHIV